MRELGGGERQGCGWQVRRGWRKREGEVGKGGGEERFLKERVFSENKGLSLPKNIGFQISRAVYLKKCASRELGSAFKITQLLGFRLLCSTLEVRIFFLFSRTYIKNYSFSYLQPKILLIARLTN